MDFSVIGFALFFWAMVELVQRLRKRSPRTSMKTGAIWAAVICQLALVGKMPSPEGKDMLAALVLSIVVMTTIYWTRVGLGKLIFRKQEAT